MRGPEQTVVDWRHVLLLLGGFYTAAGVGYAFAPVFEDMALAIDLVMVVLIGGPGLLLLYVGYRLPRTSVRPEFYRTISAYCLGSIGIILGILGLIEVAAGLRDVVQNVLILTALASTAGLAAGRYDARAKTRTRDLEQRNRELAEAKSEIEETVEQLQTANERLEQFTYAASHDLQEPLRMVSSYLQLIEDRHGGDLDDEATEYLNFAIGNADRMRAMVQSLLEYSRVSDHGEPLDVIDAADVLDTALDNLQNQIEETDAAIDVGELPEVRANPEQLAVVFENLLSNALVFSGDEPPRIHVRTERLDGAWQFSVRDEGIGIDPEYHDQIFTAFERLSRGDDATDAPAGGIGLALCERIVERHGGEIWVESDSGEGATFRFTMPPK